MARHNKQKPLPWAPKKEKQAQEGRTVDNQKFYNSTRWRKLSKNDKLHNPFCVECAKWALTKMINSNSTLTSKDKLQRVYNEVDKQKRNLEQIVKGFEEAPLVLAAAFAINKKPISDHIKSIAQGGEMMDPENIQTLCNRHHNIKSGKESHTKK